MRLASLLPIFAALGSVSCLPLQTLGFQECGNGVLDDGEDCEPFENSEFVCRPPGDALECTIQCNAAGACPTGYGCGADDVCRRPGGSFGATPIVQVGSQADELLAGDFDADRRRDVVAVEPGRARIYFTDPSGNVDQTTVTSSLPPSIGKLGPLVQATGLTVDTTDDLVLPLSVGIGALLSEGNRSFKSKAYGSVPLDTLTAKTPMGADVTLNIESAIILAMDAVPSTSGQEVAAIMNLKQPDLGVELTIFVEFGPGAGGVIFPLSPTRFENLSGPPVSGNFDEDPCEELVIPKLYSGHLRIYKVCEPDPTLLGGYRWVRRASERSALMTDIVVGGEISGPVFARDIDGDGHMDLAITATVGDSRQLRVAYGTGGGKFHSSPGLLQGQVPDGAAGLFAGLQNRSPLALTDLDGDGLVDIVDSGGISRGTLATSKDGKEEIIFPAWYPAMRPWTDVAVADVNGDGNPDVVSSSDGATDVDVLLGTPSGFWNPSQISTDGTVSQLVTGDFDGDLVQDIVYDDIRSENESLILISYGRTSGGPEEAREVGSFGKIERLLAGHVHEFGADDINELAAISVTEGSRAFSFFPGTSTRLLQAPLLLDDEKGVTYLPLAAATGLLPEKPEVIQTAGRRDLVVLSAGGNPSADVVSGASALRVWALYGGEKDADFDRQRSSTCTVQGGFHFLGLDGAHSIAVSGSALDGTGPIFVAAPFGTITGPGPDDLEISSVLGLVTMLDPEHCWDGPGPGAAVVSAPGEMYFRLRTADLNTNGTPEVLAIRKTFAHPDLLELLDFYRNQEEQMGMPQGPPSGQPALKATRSELVVLWDESMDKVYSLPEESWDVRDFTVGEIDGDGDPDLLVLDGSRIRRFEGQNGSQVLTALPDVADFSIPADGAHAILLADVDGDGIQDLAVRSQSLQVFKGKPPERGSQSGGAEMGTK